MFCKQYRAERIEKALSDKAFRDCVDGLLSAHRESLAAAAWFQHNHAGTPLTCAAYFSMEFMLSEALPIYSGGLGNVAGDQLKAASDLGVPVIGVGLLYQRGYFRQALTHDGQQQALYPYNDPGPAAHHAASPAERRVAAAGDRTARIFASGCGRGRRRWAA